MTEAIDSHQTNTCPNRMIGLNNCYCVEVEKFLQSYKKEKEQARKLMNAKLKAKYEKKLIQNRLSTLILHLSSINSSISKIYKLSYILISVVIIVVESNPCDLYVINIYKVQSFKSFLKNNHLFLSVFNFLNL